MSFKNFYFEGRDYWAPFSVKKNEKKWTFTNLESNKKFYVKINKDNIYDSMGAFLREIGASANISDRKTKDNIDHFLFASNIIKGETNKIFIKASNWEKVRKTWVLE